MIYRFLWLGFLTSLIALVLSEPGSLGRSLSVGVGLVYATGLLRPWRPILAVGSLFMRRPESEPEPEPVEVNPEPKPEGKPFSGPGVRIIPIPLPSLLGARPSKEPLWHRLVVRKGRSQHVFFDEDQGTPGASNIPLHGHLPAGSMFYLHGVRLVPDVRANPDTVALVQDTAYVNLTLGGRHVGVFPASLLIREGRSQANMNDEERSGTPMLNLTVAGKPLEVLPLMRIAATLCLPEPVRHEAGFKLVLYGMKMTQALV